MLKKAKVLKPVLKIVEWLVFAGLLILCLIILSPVLPIKNAPRTHIIVTGSMEPFIKSGSVSISKPVDPSTLKAGDIIAFTSPSDPKDTIMHRIDSISGTDPLTFKTKGDANNGIDNWDVTASGVLGIHLASIPYLGHLGAFVRKPLGFGLVIGLPALIFVISQILNIKKGIKEQIDQEVSKRVKKSSKSKLVALLAIFFITGLGSLSAINALFSNSVIVSGLTITVKDFVPPPVPTLLSPANNSYRNTLGLVMDWTDVADYENHNNPVYYIYQSSHDPFFGSLAYQSGHLSNSFIPAPGTPDGIYYWRVRACDAIDNCSAWTLPWKVTVDNIAPQAPQNLNYLNPNLPCGSITTSFRITPNWDDSLDPNISHYDYQSYNPPNNWPWSTTVTLSQYSGTFSQGYGMYGFRVRAVDKAGNVSDWTSADFDNSCQITYVPTPLDMTIGFETLATDSQTTMGECPVYASDLTQNSGNSSLQILKWNAISGATKYKVKGYRLQNNSFVQIDEYYLTSAHPWVTVSGNTFTYRTYATNPGTYAYYVEALNDLNYILGRTPVVTSSYTCTFTVDRILPTTLITNLIDVGSSQVYSALTPILNINYSITDVNPKQTDLYYTLDIGASWIKADTNTNSPLGSFAFTPPISSGSATICFDTVGIDLAGNIEIDILPGPSTLNPLSGQVYCLIYTVGSPAMALDASYSSIPNELVLNILNIPTNFGLNPTDELEYEILYTSSSLQKGVLGSISPVNPTPPSPYTVTSVEYIGTCSAGGTCTPDPLDNTTFTINLTGLIDGAPVNISQIFNL